MYIKPNQLTEIPAHVTVTRCPSADANAPALRNLRRDAEANAAQGDAPNVLARRDDKRVNPFRERMAAEAVDSVRVAERMAEQAAELRATGRSCMGFDEQGNALTWDD